MVDEWWLTLILLSCHWWQPCHFLSIYVSLSSPVNDYGSCIFSLALRYIVVFAREMFPSSHAERGTQNKINGCHTLPSSPVHLHLICIYNSLKMPSWFDKVRFNWWPKRALYCYYVKLQCLSAVHFNTHEVLKSSVSVWSDFFKQMTKLHHAFQFMALNTFEYISSCIIMFIYNSTIPVATIQC